MKKIVLAFSGGLDTTCIIPWLKEKYNAKVVAYSAQLGESEGSKNLEERAQKAGADEFYIQDLREEFIKNYAFPCLKVGAYYGEGYLLATALARPLIAKGLVETAEKTDADAVAHGCTGKGNDQVRFEIGISSLDDQLEIIAPVREWNFKSREDEIKYLKEKGLSIDIEQKGKYSIDRNLWGISVECGELEDPWNEPPKDSYIIVKPVDETPDEPNQVTLKFYKGEPIEINGNKYGKVGLVEELNRIGGKHGVGRVDMIEDRVVGIKSREVYESPAGTMLFTALRALESMVLEKDYLNIKKRLAMEYANLVYNGKWFSPLRESIQKFNKGVEKRLNGEVRIKLFKGGITVTGRKSNYSLYSEELATYTEKDEFAHSSAKGFIDLWGLPVRVWSAVERKNKNKEK